MTTEFKTEIVKTKETNKIFVVVFGFYIWFQRFMFSFTTKKIKMHI
jgi:hypothetical protein